MPSQRRWPHRRWVFNWVCCFPFCLCLPFKYQIIFELEADQQYQIRIQKKVFQMKNRKQKVVQPKKVLVLSEQSNLIPSGALNYKHTSSHTKMSTNCVHPTTQKNHKNKKNSHSASKDNPNTASRELSAKANIKLRGVNVGLGGSCESEWRGDVSYREYCVVDERFVPITNTKEQKLLQDFLAKTASTSYDFNSFGVGEMSRSNQKLGNSRLRRRSISSHKLPPAVLPEIQKEDKAVSNMQQPKTYSTALVEAVPECCEIGLQYSQRKQQMMDGGVPIVCQSGSELNSKQDALVKSDNNNGQESLSDLLFKLQFTHLGDNQCFTTLSSHEKEHFTQLLETVMTKLQLQSPKKRKIKPIEFNEYPRQNGTKQQAASGYDSLKGNSLDESLSAPVVNYEKLEQLIVLREFVQRNQIQDVDFNAEDPSRINTSLLSIVNFLGHLFCFIEVQYVEQFLFMIRKTYGLTFKEKYRRMTRRVAAGAEKRSRVVDETVFLDFINENDSNYYSNNQIIHYKAVFDAFNEHLEEYRPYYLGNGEQFPWAFKMFTTMSEYSIDEDSLQIIFRQAKDKVMEWASMMCGIIVNHSEPVMLPNNPLEVKRRENENAFVTSWIGAQNFEKDGIELYSTQTLHESAEELFSFLVEEIISEAAFFFN